jgi:hypothetical protein
VDSVSHFNKKENQNNMNQTNYINQSSMNSTINTIKMQQIQDHYPIEMPPPREMPDDERYLRERKEK